MLILAASPRVHASGDHHRTRRLGRDLWAAGGTKAVCRWMRATCSRR